MKTIILFLSLITLHKVTAQTDTLKLYQIYSSFSNAEKAEWTSFNNNWFFVAYPALFEKYNIKRLNCNNCGSFYADIYLVIDQKGKIQVIKFLNGKKCGKPCYDKDFIDAFESSLKHYEFKSLKNKTFIARFGQILKC